MSEYIKLGEWLRADDYEIVFSKRWTGILDPNHPEDEDEEIMAIVKAGEQPEPKGDYE